MDSGTGTGVFSDDYETLISPTDADLLKRSWRNEKAAPEIIKFGSEISRTDSIDVRGGMARSLNFEETVEELMQNGEDPLTVSLYQMDIDRTTFLLRSYLRTRLQKIEKFMFHIQKTADLWARLSKQEQKFARRSIEDMKQHFEQSVLSKLPERYNSHSKQSVISEEDDMVKGQENRSGKPVKPNFNTPFRSKEDSEGHRTQFQPLEKIDGNTSLARFGEQVDQTNRLRRGIKKPTWMNENFRTANDVSILVTVRSWVVNISYLF
ncbi:DNA replication protein [Artemisia annua]|uniref:DNA replication complex GINS protein SLD5 n=1 Tax=Artemisia annua TaxID=35608 RepID=A0A2U1LF05_ARTAN|nr:DNA replication protein [Artemisia annua]